jgi:hypothetical protein
MDPPVQPCRATLHFTEHVLFDRGLKWASTLPEPIAWIAAAVVTLAVLAFLARDLEPRTRMVVWGVLLTLLFMLSLQFDQAYRQARERCHQEWVRDQHDQTLHGLSYSTSKCARIWPSEPSG